MDWMNVEPDVYRLINKHYTPGRGGQKIKYIVRHHNAGILTIDGCWQVWQDRPASAHYQVENSGRIGQLVNDSDTAWHAANQLRNQQSIGIEHANSGGADQDWPISDTVIKQGARLAAALCRYYKLGRPEYGKNIRDHKETGSTSCPYHLAYGGKYHQAWMNEAQRFYDELTGKTPVKTPKKSTGGNVTMNAVDQVNAHTRAFITGFFTPQFDAIQEIWRQLRGPSGKGWPQLGQDSEGRNLTLVDAVASIRQQLAQLQADVDELKRRKK
ncbi:N-acetylmuramoyl-L-alanine amidase [Corynebacterium minutissimum]|uniref:N-acetylmuramoyl-L-alanine amidase n=1 Tax=Corynebacterium minutissimum TaxID=38301 RepID=UPI001EF2D1E0|nr:peptidoglycan recognition family protein [Corynebacterium minutissimum]MCG7239561.1 N-acetylmuramoyl-L-alanine amidase [Corynebacterium minutissimum]